jgi:Flp pilus assembly protein TadG
MSRDTDTRTQSTASDIQSGFACKGRANLRHKKGERGQGFMELAISLVFLLILVSVVIDLGWAFYTMISLRDAVQEAAAYGAMCPMRSDNITQNSALIRQRLRLSATTPLDMNDIDPANVSVVFTNAAGTQLSSTATPIMGGSVVITATIQHEIMTPFLGAIIGRQNYPLTVTASNTVMRSKWMQPCDE